MNRLGERTWIRTAGEALKSALVLEHQSTNRDVHPYDPLTPGLPIIVRAAAHQVTTSASSAKLPSIRSIRSIQLKITGGINSSSVSELSLGWP